MTERRIMTLLGKVQNEGIVICVNRVHKNVAIFSTIWVIKLRELRVLQNVSHSIRAHKLCSGMQLFSRSFCNIAHRGLRGKTVIHHIPCPVSCVIVATCVTNNHKMFLTKNPLCFKWKQHYQVFSIHTNSLPHSDLRRWHFLRTGVDWSQVETSLQHVKV